MGNKKEQVDICSIIDWAAVDNSPDQRPALECSGVWLRFENTLKMTVSSLTEWFQVNGRRNWNALHLYVVVYEQRYG